MSSLSASTVTYTSTGHPVRSTAGRSGGARTGRGMHYRSFGVERARSSAWLFGARLWATSERRWAMSAPLFSLALASAMSHR
jgi:hypothetical protein